MLKKTIIFLFLLSPTLVLAENDLQKCLNEAQTTIDINSCHYENFEKSELQLKTYLSKIYNEYKDDKVFIDALKESQIAWEKYKEKDCNAVYAHWRDGTIRGAMSMGCKVKLNKDRTFKLWEDYLTYMDSTPPMLPEPK